MSLIQRLRAINPWHFVWICILLSGVLSQAFTLLLGRLGWWSVSGEHLVMVALEALLVSILVAPLVIYVIKHQGQQLAVSNQALEREVAQRRRVEQALMEKEERYRTIFEKSGDAVFILDGEGDRPGRILEANQTAADWHGYTMEQLRRLSIDQVSTPQAAALAEERIKRIISGQWLKFETEHLTREGAILPLEVTAGSFLAGGRRYVMAFDRDISERRRAEEELRHSEERHRSLVENLPYGLFICEADSGRFLFSNATIRQLSGYSQEQLLALTIWDLLPPQEHAGARERLGHRLAGQRQTQRSVYTGIRQDGSTFRCEVAASVVAYQGRTALQGFVRDVTEEENLERQLLRAQKLEALGTLASGVAHEFNNILMAIRGYTQLLAGRPGRDDQVEGYLRRIDSITRRAASLTGNMLGLARLESGEMGLVDLNQVLQGMAGLLGQTLAPSIVLGLDTQADLTPVRANTSQLEQVLLNLALNASDAMPQGGTLTFRSRGHLADGEFRSRHPWAQAARYVELMVEDTGQGMPAQVLQRICEPFFTTKEPGKGTGLGLSVAFSIIKSHGGELEVESLPGQGSRFSVFLPAQEPADGQTQPPAAQEEPPPRGQGQRILVVDDEYSVREISREALEAFGYAVEEAADGQEALERFRQARQAGRPFDLVVLDLSMPRMDGRQCLRRILELDPGARVVMATGHISDPTDLDDMSGHLARLLRKPFDLGTLLREVGEVLAGPHGDTPRSPRDN